MPENTFFEGTKKCKKIFGTFWTCTKVACAKKTLYTSIDIILRQSLWIGFGIRFPESRQPKFIFDKLLNSTKHNCMNPIFLFFTEKVGITVRNALNKRLNIGIKLNEFEYYEEMLSCCLEK